MTCSHQFRTTTPYRLLGVVNQEQLRLNPTPTNPGDYVRLPSREIFNLADLQYSDTALYNALTKLTINGLLEVNQCPDHDQRFVYSITAQGQHCFKCKHFDNEAANSVEFRCGPVNHSTIYPVISDADL